MMSYNLNLTGFILYFVTNVYRVAFLVGPVVYVSSVELLAWLQTQPTRVIKNRSGAGQASSSMSVRL